MSLFGGFLTRCETVGHAEENQNAQRDIHIHDSTP